VIAAALPAIVGGLSIDGSARHPAIDGHEFGPVHFFAQPVVVHDGFRVSPIDTGCSLSAGSGEEIAVGLRHRGRRCAARLMTARAAPWCSRRHVIDVSAASLFLLPQGFVKSLTLRW